MAIHPVVLPKNTMDRGACGLKGYKQFDTTGATKQAWQDQGEQSEAHLEARSSFYLSGHT